MQLTIGLCLLAASALAYFEGPFFLIFTALIGTGLVVAGSTGFCGLARVMGLMPWNQRMAQQKQGGS